jgi:3-mercaptopyruvate sulfurtransferase SseA
MVAGLAFVIACAEPAERPKVVANAATPAAADSHDAEHADDAPRITLADAKAAYDAGEAVIVDTRPSESYKQEHIKGALNFTASDVAAKADTLPKAKKIIAYCS